ncbi:MAG TPA: alkaline phosphatase family protein [Polyangia bacterium]
MRFRSRLALTLATFGVLVAIVRACLRPAARAESERQPAVCLPAVAPRVALIVVDALRADTFFGEAFARFREAHPTAATGLVRTSPVSMSTAGVRSMATGTFPDLFDVLHNWDNVASDLPGVPGLARAAGRDTELYGDSIWREMFPRGFVVAETEVKVPRIIFYLRAETLVDETRVKRLVARLGKQPPPDFLVLHLVGLDHAGHRHGVKSAAYVDIARRTVGHIENVVRLLPADTTVLLTSDHGATDSGGHGGASEAETTAPLFAFGPGIVAGAKLNINQIDLAPTLSCLLGLPFPTTSLGRPAVELFDEPAPARLERLRAGLSQVEQAWAKPTGLETGGDLGGNASGGDALGLDARALDRRFAAILTAFTRNVTRTRAPVALWGLVLLIFLIAQMGERQKPRGRSVAAVALLLSAGIVLTALSSRWSLLGLGLCLAAAAIPCAVGEWNRTRFASPVHLLWLLSAGAAVLLALARNHQGRRTTLLFGSPSDIRLAIGGAALCLALRALERRVRATTGERSSHSSLMLPIVFLAVMEGGDAAIAIGNGFFVAWLLWDAAEGWWARREGHALRTIGALAAGALLALYLVPRWDLAWIRTASVSTAVGAVAALSALWLMRPRPTTRWGSLAIVVLPALVLGVDLLRRGPLGETAVELGLALLLASVLGFAMRRWWGEDTPAGRWGMACVLVGLWWVLSTPPQRLVVGFAVLGLVAFVRTIDRAARPAVASVLVGLALAYWRWGLVGHFEGEFGFGSLEISLAYVGNPGRHVPQGALTILLKVWLPLAVAAAVFANEADGGEARAIVRATAFVVGARIVHLALATAFNPDSFYTMHRILGELTHQIVLLIGVGLFSLAMARRQSSRRKRRTPAGSTGDPTSTT